MTTAKPSRVDRGWELVVKGLGGFVFVHATVLREDPNLVIGLVGIAVAALPTDQLVSIVRLWLGRRNGNGNGGNGSGNGSH